MPEENVEEHDLPLDEYHRIDRIPTGTVWELLTGAAPTTASLTVRTDPSYAADRLWEALGARRWYPRRWSRAPRRLKYTLESGPPIESVAVPGGGPGAHAPERGSALTGVGTASLPLPPWSLRRTT